MGTSRRPRAALLCQTYFFLVRGLSPAFARTKSAASPVDRERPSHPEGWWPVDMLLSPVPYMCTSKDTEVRLHGDPPSQGRHSKGYERAPKHVP
ncbi:hypothetical protein LY78DRAFT_663414 [Colletotrichum sublineola]|nr:hypothetical protein LY78DRAFT_663414 [Colletotrichum sublineola]